MEVDNQSDKGYNNFNSVTHAPYDVHEEVIRMSGQTPLNNPQCDHEFREDPSDTIGDKVAWICMKPNCGVGHWRDKSKSSL